MQFPFIERVLAANIEPILSTGSSSSILVNLGNNIFSVLMLIAGIVAVFYLMYAGWLYITSAGNPENTKKARAGIAQAVIGIVIVTSAFFIVRLVGSVSREANCSQVTEAAAHANCVKGR